MHCVCVCVFEVVCFDPLSQDTVRGVGGGNCEKQNILHGKIIIFDKLILFVIVCDVLT